MSKRALLLVNCHARRAGSDLDEGIARLRAAGIEVIARTCRRKQDVADYLRQHHEGVDLVILGGGDGTLNAALEPLRRSRLPLGILPLGTANDLARTLQIPIDLGAAFDIVAAGCVQRIDLGEVNGKLFLNVASLGLSVAASEQLTHARKRRWGMLGYPIALARALRAMRPFSAEIVCNGRTQKLRAIQVAVGNGRHYGGGMTVAEDATIDDHLLHLYAIEPMSLAKLAMLAPAFRRGQHGRWREVHVIEGDDITVRTTRPKRINTDGDVTTQTPARFRVLPSALPVFVPPAAARQPEFRHAAAG